MDLAGDWQEMAGMPAVVQRGKRSFQIWGFSGPHKVSFHYADDRGSSKSYEGEKVLADVLRSIKWVLSALDL